MPRKLQAKIHSDFSSDPQVWENYFQQILTFKTGEEYIPEGDIFIHYFPRHDFNDHLFREFNRKIEALNQSQNLMIKPYDGGFRVTSNPQN